MATELQGATCLVEEEERFHGLHPLKRFKILEKERVMLKIEKEVDVEREDASLHRENELGVIKVCNLPAKKRVCAIQFFTDEEDEQENKNLPTKKKRVSEGSSVAARALQPINSNRHVSVSMKPEERVKEVKKTRDASTVVTRANLPPILNRHVSVHTEANRRVPVTTGEGPTDQNVVKLVKKRREASSVALHHTSHRQLSASSSRIGEREIEELKEASLAITTGGGTATCNRQVPVAAEVNCESVSVTTGEEQRKETEKTSCVANVQPIHDRQVSVATRRTENGTVAKEVEEKCSADESDGEDDGVFCDVCKGADAEPSDPIVFCDGCNVMVHPSCYGSPLNDAIPAGDWFCRQCESESRRKKADESKKGSHVGFHVGQRTCASRVCCLCPSRKGAMKRTTGGAWAHLSCALYVPEVFYRRARDREGIECGSVPAWRWELPCVVCSTRGQGSCIQCTEVGCSSTFHVSCALNAGLTIDFRNANALTKTPAIVIAFCPSHSRQALTSSERRRFKIVPRG